MRTLHITSDSPAHTRRIAVDIIKECGMNIIIGLHGELGAGKTCFVQGLAIALKISGPVTSPTFNIVNEYKGTAPLFHIDLYRLSPETEMFSFDLESYLDSSGVKAVEWAERAGTLIPESSVNVFFEYGHTPESRHVTLRLPA